MWLDCLAHDYTSPKLKSIFMKLFLPIHSFFIEKNTSMYIIKRLFKIVLFLWTLKRTAAVQLRFTNCIYLYFVSGPSLCQFCINEICQEKWHQYIVCTNTFICMLWRKRRRKNVKRPDSPDVDREGGRPTKMWDI